VADSETIENIENKRHIKRRLKMRNSLLEKRKHILESLGGLPGVDVKNREWLYILGEETRYSIMIEGTFVSEEELEKALGGNIPEKRNVEEAMNYFRTASFVYQLAYQNYKTEEFFFPVSLVRQVNKGVLGKGGDFRKGDIKIAGSKFVPPPFSTLLKLMQIYTRWTEEHFKVLNPIALSAKSHALFEVIHPFEDGNGRTGRILLNYLLISAGYPPVILKGDKEKYYSALEKSERVFRRRSFVGMEYEKLCKLMEEMKVDKLQDLIVTSLIENIDRIIISLFQEKGKTLLKSSDVAKKMGYSKESIRTLIRRGKFIAIKIGKTWFTHPELFLG